MRHVTDKQKLTVYYDNECPVCSSFISSVGQSSQKQHLTCNALQKRNKKDLVSEEFHVISHDGKIYRKFEAVLKIGELYPQWKNFITLARVPGIHTLLSWGYNIFASHRYMISKLLDRFSLLKIILILAMASVLLLSPKLWLSSRVYPTIPMIPFLPAIPFPYDYGIFFTLLILLVLSLVLIHSRIYMFLFTLIVMIYILWDQSRLQPYLYQYLLMFTVLSFYSWNTKSKNHTMIINLCGFIVACTYFYSGMQKINATFILSIFPWMIEPVLRFIPKEFAVIFASVGVLAPLIEMSIGVGLLTKRFRNLAIIAALGMHSFILFSIGPLGHNWNSVVWPWNIAMCFFVVVLFWQNKYLTISSLFSFKKPLHLIIIFLYGILPLLSFFNIWDSYLSSTNYSGNTKTAQISIRNSAFGYLNPQLRQYVSQTGKKYSTIDIQSWSAKEMNALDYPESKIFKTITKSLCKQAHNPLDILLSIHEKPDWYTRKITTTIYACNDLPS